MSINFENKIKSEIRINEDDLDARKAWAYGRIEAELFLRRYHTDQWLTVRKASTGSVRISDGLYVYYLEIAEERYGFRDPRLADLFINSFVLSCQAGYPTRSH